MKFIPLSIHLQTIAELYEKCAQLSEQLHQQNSKNDQDAKSTNENTQISNSIEIDDIQNISPKSQITKTKENIKLTIKKFKTQNNSKVQSQCLDCNQVYEVKVKKKNKKHKHKHTQNKKSKKNRQIIKKLKSQKQQKQFEIYLNERTNSENSKKSKSEIKKTSILENENDQNENDRNENDQNENENQENHDEFEISL
ncbi:unnamed protein product [Paramecium sonneborni]|uniref:C2H2-type domain-containing protein n=1 Tax=Paramecium sonneborni TaxID=65129 RepID=A0A8S1QTC4_9CILI|nr:unnamed protein product [Paramecium sonneborni]